MTKQDIISYLNSLRKSPEEDPQHKWIKQSHNIDIKCHMASYHGVEAFELIVHDFAIIIAEVAHCLSRGKNHEVHSAQ